MTAHAQDSGRPHAMAREIREQPHALSLTIQAHLDPQRRALALDAGVELAPERMRALRSVQLIGCGSAALAGMVGSYLLEGLARVPARVELASEFRERDPLVGPQDLVIALSQSGETADTLGALEVARERGALTLSITNVRGSPLAHAADGVLYTRAGPELSIPSTKCFTTKIAVLHLLALELARLRETLAPERIAAQIRELCRLPALVESALGLWPEIASIAQHFAEVDACIFLGRDVGYPIALEGALKLKETCYVHADAYAAGELSHGPMALITRHTPVVVVASPERARAKVHASAARVRGHGAKVIGVAARADLQIRDVADHVLRVPEASDPLAAVLAAVPLQIFAYEMALLRGIDMDRPRNLAKSVAVE
jgi:glutamine---fructose-6-phosphate transaminase (isomerizing)